MPLTRGGRRASRDVRMVSGGFFHPPKKGVLQSFSFELSSEADFEDHTGTVGMDEIIESTYKGYSVGDNDIVFDVKVVVTQEEISIELIRISQKHSAVHLVQCQAVPKGDVMGRSNRGWASLEMDPLDFTPMTFNIHDKESSSAYECQPWASQADFDIHWEEGLEQPDISISGSILYEEPPSTLQQEVATLLNDEENSDVQICVGIGGKKFAAHKNILSARSTFFRGMFSTNMRESKESVVNLPEDSPELFEQVLQYIYTDKCPDISNMPADLFVLADKFDVKGLRALCEEEMKTSLNTENVCDFLMKSGMIDAKGIYDTCCLFIKTKKDVITKSVDWAKVKEMAQSQKYLSDFIRSVES